MAYNRQLVAERLEDLRKPGGKTISLRQLSKEIEKKTGVSISTTQLSKYENSDESNIMSVENMMAIADYYDVSYDYILGYSDTKKRENIDIHQQTGLSEKAIERLRSFNNRNSKFNQQCDFKTMEPINSLLEHIMLPKLILYVHEAKKYSEFQIPDEVIGKDCMDAEKAAAKIGGIVLQQEDAVRFFQQEAIKVLQDIMYELIPEKKDWEL